MLGGFRADVDGQERLTEAWPRRRAAGLIKLLALAPGHRLLRDRAIDALWPNLTTAAGAANLRKGAYHVRGALDVGSAVVLRSGVVELLPEGSITTDVEDFDRAADEAMRSAAIEDYRRATASWGGELLPDERYEPWTDPERGRLQRRFIEMPAGAQRWGSILELEPVNERVHREILRGPRHGRSVRSPAAVRAQRGSLREELGVGPDRESVLLYEQVLDLEARKPPTPTQRARTLLAWGIVHWERSELEEAERTATQARAFAVDAGLGPELSGASELLGLIA